MPRSGKDTISRITEKVAGELAEWSARPLDPIYPVIFVDAIAGLGPGRAGAQHPVLCRHGGHHRLGRNKYLQIARPTFSF